MKLWLKQTLITLTVILLSVSLCLYYFVAKETDGLIQQAIRNGERDTAVFCDHLSTLDRTSSTSYDADGVARQSLIQYTFSTYAHLLQSGDCSWSLVMDGRYFYNTAVHDPLNVLPMAEEIITASRIVETGGTHLLISAQNMTVLQTPVTVYRTANIDETYRHIDDLTRMAQLSLLGCLLLCGVLLPLILRKTLKPLRKLTRVSEKIAGGDYGLRSQIQTGDEVGDLSRSFDHMAETVEQKISDLEETARRREMLLGALTHEMKTPMTAIIGFSGSLLSMPLTEEGRLEAAHEINEAAKRTERLSQKMMQLISMQENPVVLKKSIDTQELLDKVCTALTPAAKEKQIELQTELQIDSLTGDPDLLFSLLTNFTDNAIKASPENTVICLTADTSNGLQIVSVIDQGSGIPADQIALVTEPFYRVDKARSRKLGGAGLGLSLCQMIAQAHGGRLEIQSEVEKGTMISMIWPMEEKGNE
ncbi:MAG: HAMP domain-containing histidine kinase [Clostridia bacterium]|nr:HAMP domain-containing histidine kinase [Clostridia bacterium]